MKGSEYVSRATGHAWEMSVAASVQWTGRRRSDGVPSLGQRSFPTMKVAASEVPKDVGGGVGNLWTLATLRTSSLVREKILQGRGRVELAECDKQGCAYVVS